MRIIYLLSIISLLQSSSLYSQQNELYRFQIDGHINADTGTVKLDILGDSDYYPSSVKKMVAKVENKKFSLNGYIPYPQGFRLTYGRYYSDIFVIDPGNQSIICNMDSVREIPKVDNLSMKEYYDEYTEAFKQVRHKRDLFKIKRDSLTLVYQKKLPDDVKLDLERELKGYYIESDSTLLEYVKLHPNSYIALWKFIHLSSGFGYENIFDSILLEFSDSLKSTYAGKTLTKNLKIASMLSIGKKFPHIYVIDIQSEELDYSSFLRNEYTLVDFWFSNCGPCIKQFPHLMKTYEKYNDKGLEIVGISTDKIKYEKKWQNSIQKHKLLWPQYWDKDGLESSKLSITAFPTNFLLDRHGKIIRKNIGPAELEQFLQENIK